MYKYKSKNSDKFSTILINRKKGGPSSLNDYIKFTLDIEDQNNFFDYLSENIIMHFMAALAIHIELYKYSELALNLLLYFYPFIPQVQPRVKTVTIDLNCYYPLVARELFPNAQIVIDRFHMVQMLTRSFNSLRVQIMK